jgi:CubicO group peptidase (beta-lactamase class C family)/D-alanyl-D-alanine dipeptidase
MKAHRRWSPFLRPGVAIVLAATPLAAQDSVPARADYVATAALLTRFIDHEMADKDLPAVSIVLVDDTAIVWARGFGFARPRDSVPATAQTVYRVGSVSKLFTDIAIMRLAQRGTLDLDAPITRWLPDFRPANRFGGAITLRQLMTHHSGLVREPPVGSYFDSTAPPLAAIAASLNRTALAFRPGTRYKYSNAALQVVGHVLERAAGEPFPRYLHDSVLLPLGMTRSAFFEPAPGTAPDLAAAVMWAPDGRRFAAPTFRRNAPSGTLYTTVEDLGRFLAALFADSNPVLPRATLERMWVPQFADSGATRGNGLGFFVWRFDGHRAVGHDGAIYGFATTLIALPDEQLGVVVVTTLDAANTVTARAAEAALRAMLARRAGMPVPEPPVTQPLPPGAARSAAGHYVRGSRVVDLLARSGDLLVARDGSAVPSRVRALGDSLIFDDVLSFGGSVRLLPGAVVADGDTFSRAAEPEPPLPPARWTRLLGEYGWGYETLFAYERDGRLHVLIEWTEDDAMSPVSDTVFAFPATSMYGGERLTFRGTRSPEGRATAAIAGAVTFPRRTIGPQGGGQLKVTPLHPVAELLATARTATPPAESGAFRAPELVDLATLDATIHFDIRYATTNNFLGSVFYSTAHAFLQRPAAEALLRAARSLRARGFGLLIHDGYRPWYVTKTFWDATPPGLRWLVADPAHGSRHNRGCAVDLTLYDLRTGRPIGMGGTYDETTERSYPDYPVTTDLERWHRDVLRQALEDEGFTRIPNEWWHFDYRDWREYPILNLAFEDL